ncbi:MAG: inositol monophosphatase family protein, partial [Dehalococcoidia bacterium]
VLGFDMGYVDDKGRMLLEMLLGLWPGMQSIRLMGSAALGMAYAAVGRIDLYAHHHVEAWDIAPGLLLVEEAGGTVTNIKGAEAVPDNGTVVAGGQRIHERFMEATSGTAWRES